MCALSGFVVGLARLQHFFPTELWQKYLISRLVYHLFLSQAINLSHKTRRKITRNGAKTKGKNREINALIILSSLCFYHQFCRDSLLLISISYLNRKKPTPSLFFSPSHANLKIQYGIFFTLSLSNLGSIKYDGEAMVIFNS